MKYSTIADMINNHSGYDQQHVKEFQFLVECLKSGNLPLLFGPIKILEPDVMESRT